MDVYVESAMRACQKTLNVTVLKPCQAKWRSGQSKATSHSTSLTSSAGQKILTATNLSVYANARPLSILIIDSRDLCLETGCHSPDSVTGCSDMHLCLLPLQHIIICWYGEPSNICYFSTLGWLYPTINMPYKEHDVSSIPRGSVAIWLPYIASSVLIIICITSQSRCDQTQTT